MALKNGQSHGGGGGGGGVNDGYILQNDQAFSFLFLFFLLCTPPPPPPTPPLSPGLSTSFPLPALSCSLPLSPPHADHFYFTKGCCGHIHITPVWFTFLYHIFVPSMLWLVSCEVQCCLLYKNVYVVTLRRYTQKYIQPTVQDRLCATIIKSSLFCFV